MGGVEVKSYTEWLEKYSDGVFDKVADIDLKTSKESAVKLLLANYRVLALTQQLSRIADALESLVDIMREEKKGNGYS